MNNLPKVVEQQCPIGSRTCDFSIALLFAPPRHYNVVQCLSNRLNSFHYPNVTIRYVRVFAIAIPSVCLSVCLSSVTLVYPTQGLEAFLVPCHPLTSVQNFTEIVPGEPLRRERQTQERYQNRAILDLSWASLYFINGTR